MKKNDEWYIKECQGRGMTGQVRKKKKSSSTVYFQWQKPTSNATLRGKRERKKMKKYQYRVGNKKKTTSRTYIYIY